MTVDDENSIYVGGLPYECSESQLRRAFELYGSIVAVKVINDRGIGGKCYGFVTFTNPRSAAEAIEEMDGRTIGGRVVRVNEVTTRGAVGRSNYGRENFRHIDRNVNREKGRGRERESDYDNDRWRGRSREHDGDQERRYDHARDHDHPRDHLQGRDRDNSREVEEHDRGSSRIHDQDWEKDEDLEAAQHEDLDRVVEHDRVDKHRDRYTRRKKGSGSYDRQSREHSSESSDYHHQVEEQLDMLIQRREQLQKEKSDVEQRVDEKKQQILDLHKRTMKLEDALASSKKLTLKRQMQLSQLHKCFQQVKKYGERLKSSEQDLQDLVISVSMEIDADDDLGVTDVYLANGKVQQSL